MIPDRSRRDGNRANPPPSHRIAGAILAYAAGDALGGPWEGLPPERIERARVLELPAREGWPRGATSDDTAQMLLLAGVLVRNDGEFDAATFMEELARALPTMRGTGSTTRRAVERYRRDGSLRAPDGRTNGAMMRPPPIGWRFPPEAAGERRRATRAMTETTHGAPEAVATAAAVTAMASAAIEGVGHEALVEAALAELGTRGGVEEIGRTVAAAASGAWQPPQGGIGLDCIETLAAVVAILRRRLPPAESMLAAVELGGDTDTVAAIVGGLLGPRLVDPAAELPWLAEMHDTDTARVHHLAAVLAALRTR